MYLTYDTAGGLLHLSCRKPGERSRHRWQVTLWHNKVLGWGSRYIDGGTAWTTENLRFDPWQEQGILLFSETSELALEPT